MAKTLEKVDNKVLDKAKHYFSRIPEGYNFLTNAVVPILRGKLRLRKVNQLGQKVRVFGKPLVNNHKGFISVGNKVIIFSTAATTELKVNPDARLEIGEATVINYGCTIEASELIRIGRDCLIGHHTMILDNDYHGIEDRHKPPPYEPVILEDNVWLGARVMVLKGVTIGRDSVVAAGSIVTKSIPPRSIAAGMPARVIKTF